jgi:hypothetical protein
MTRITSTSLAAIVWLSIVLAALGRTCQSAGSVGALAPDSTTVGEPPATTAQVQTPSMADRTPVDLAGLHNIVAFHEGFYSGGVPEGDAGFDTLVALGVKTVISVDGAVPDLDRARARGLRYIHLPIGYNGFDDTRKLELVRATRDSMANGPVYLHCHHGKHRSAGAAGAIAVSLGWLATDAAVDRMKVSGTAPNYKGLYACATNAVVLEASVINAAPANFPEVSPPPSFVEAMVEIDHINDHLKLIEKAGWVAPKDHPDLVPSAEAGRMADLFRLVSESKKSKANPEDFAAALRADADRIAALERMLVAGERDHKKMSEQFKAVQASCKDCHAMYRD